MKYLDKVSREYREERSVRRLAQQYQTLTGGSYIMLVNKGASNEPKSYDVYLLTKAGSMSIVGDSGMSIAAARKVIQELIYSEIV